jgi:hypothetical protein
VLASIIRAMIALMIEAASVIFLFFIGGSLFISTV